MLHKEITEKIIKAFFNVYNELGCGFLEKVYENALLNEFEDLGQKAEPQRLIIVKYKGRSVGNYYADFVIEDKVIVELKAAECLQKIHAMQLMNYLKATDLEVGLLLNFGAKAEFQRVIFSNHHPKKRARIQQQISESKSTA